MMQSAKAILVLGMHRSGTSATARTLNLLGAELGAHLVDPADDNTKGFWEHADAVDINDGLLFGLHRSWDDIRGLPKGWEATPAAGKAVEEIQSLVRREFGHSSLWALKDPRLCRVVPAWTTALTREGVEPLFLFVMRHPTEVAQSLAKRDGISLEFGYTLWLRYVLESELATRPYRRVMILYDDLLKDWRSCMRHVSHSLGIDLIGHQNGASHSEIDGYLDAGDRHHWAGRERLLPFIGLKIDQAAISAYRTASSVLLGKAKWEDLQKYQHVVDRFTGRLTTSSLALLDMLQYSRSRQYSQKVGYEKALATLNMNLGKRDEAISRLECLAKGRLDELEGLNASLGERDAAIARLETMLRERLTDVHAISARLDDTDRALSEARSLALGRLEELQGWAARVAELESAYAKVEALALERLALVESLTQDIEKARS